MPVSILPLSNSRLSLEFVEQDSPRVRKAIKDLFGGLDESRKVVHSEIRFGGCKFIFYHEWDDWCLISASSEGNDHLTKIAEHMGPPT